MVSIAKLVGIKFTAVKHHSLDKSAWRGQLHLDMKNGAPIVPCFDIHDRQFVLIKIFQVEGTLDRHVKNGMRQIQNRIEQTDQANFIFD